MFEISPPIPLPLLRWGRVRVGVDRIKTFWSPLSSLPSHQGRGDYWGDQKKLEENSQI
jgi:hypothetical protein